MMSSKEHTTTFWQFLNQYKIEIPIIQRDYAQGRNGKEILRKNFLSDLKTALDNPTSKKMKLDFVYGSRENGILYPLDGQQRLTTLWLLHWYFALRSHNLEKASKTLKNFSYETRTSSREFCESLCVPENFGDYKGHDIADYITNQTWFYSAWKHDPTVQSMLRMLGGSKDSNIADGIQKIFNCGICIPPIHGKECKFNEYYNKLINDNCPIVFYYLEKDFGNSDDLYIKMNARGEQLTSFENFKADLIGYISLQAEKEKATSKCQKQWESLMDGTKGFPIKMDTTWTDIFWKNKIWDNESKDYKIDDLYFAFLNRFFLNWRISKIKDEKGDGYKYLTGNDDGDNAIVYETINDYFFEEKIDYDLFNQLKNILNNYYESKIDESTDVLRYDKEWNDKFFFIPQYEKDQNPIKSSKGEVVNKIYTITQKERVAFYAICKYFNENPVELINGKLDYTSLKRWMRVVWNIISVQTADGRDLIRNVAEMKNAIELIDKIQDSHRVYERLSGFKRSDFSGSLLKDQFAEEIAKAKQILDNGKLREYHGSFKYGNWEDIIIDAEKTAFFKGSIRFLYQGSDGKTVFNGNAWDTIMFDRKFSNAINYFKVNKFPVIKLLKHCTDEQIKTIWSKYSFEYKNWKPILLQDNFEPIHDFLSNIHESVQLSILQQDICKLLPVIKSPENNSFSDVKLLQDWLSCKVVLTNYSSKINEPYNRWVFEVGNESRNNWNNMVCSLCSQANSTIEIHPPKAWGNECYNCSEQVYYRGLWTNFKYNYNGTVYFFTYYGDNTIYLMNDNWEGKQFKPNASDNYSFKIDVNVSEADFKKNLDTAIKDYLKYHTPTTVSVP